ncbi:MAG: ABC transporter permease [Anaerolineaceae bacterium]|nr:ABC transporter permease [Anaerolineaceae bacterium]
MSKRKMFLKMITASLMRRRSRMLVALLAIAVGGTILSGLVTIYRDVPRQMGAQMRNYGANMIFVPAQADVKLSMPLIEEAASYIDKANLIGVTPYRYETVRIHEQPVMVAATNFEGAKATSPYWLIDGEWPSGINEILVGQDTANTLGLKPGDTVAVVYSNAEDDSNTPNFGTDMKVTGILETGGSEEEYVYMTLEDMADLTGESADIELTGVPSRIDLAELSISASGDVLQGYIDEIEKNVSAVSPRLVKRVTASETAVLTKLQSLVLLVTIVVLILTMICVATTMNAVVTERRKEIGLRKALGASDRSIVAEFMGEGLLLGLIGGILGVILGFAFAQYVSREVFSSSITFQFALVPLTIIVSILVTGLACYFPVRSATEVDPALVLKGE